VEAASRVARRRRARRFANVEPAGAAQAIDRMLHGAISDLARRRAISSAAGEVFVLPVGRRGLVPRLSPAGLATSAPWS
jgi:hypothetical protein